MLFSACIGQPITAVLNDFVGDMEGEAHDAIKQLEMSGEPVDIFLRAADGRPFELVGTPSGAMIRLVFREATLLDDKLRAAEARVTAADTLVQNHEWQQDTLGGLIKEAPIIAWHRTAEGNVNWSGGEIRSRGGSISAEQAVDLIVARTKFNRQPVLAGQPQKSRIEIVVNDGAETVSLHVIEIVRPDGTRIGLATDASTAASAERTLTRFVQTMTETFAHLTVGLAIFDRNQTLALFNPALVQMWQVEPAWLARRPSLRDIIDELRATRRLPELQDFHKWRSRLVNLFENTEAADYEELWHLADGSNIRVLARPHPHGSLAFIFDDVTERMRLEQRYRHSIDLRRATLDGLNEGIAVFGANGLLQFVNQSFHEIWGTDSESIYAAMHARQLLSFCEELTLEGEIWHRLHSFITGEQSRRAWTARLSMRSGRVLTARFAPLPDGSTLAVFTDITDSERIAIALRQSNDNVEIAEATREAILYRSRDKLIEAIEDLETVFSGAASQNGGLSEPVASVSEITNQLSRLRAAADEIEGLAETDMIGAMQDETPTRLHALVAFTTNLFAQRLSDAGLSVSVTPLANEPEEPIFVKRSAIVKVVFGLLTRACERCRSGSKIGVSYAAHDRDIEIRFTVTTSEPFVLNNDNDDASTLVAPAVHAVIAECNARLEIEDFDPDRILVRCIIPRSAADAKKTAPVGIADGDPARDDSNVHSLDAAGAFRTPTG
ncbi:MAG: PAS-domain containing protein [Pseudomonadota bacterium]